MLCDLRVENLALIESLHLQFEGAEDEYDLVVMTGETGAGKSIMLRAIKMLTGERAKSDWIRSGTKQCTVEALFEINQEHKQCTEFLEESGFGDDSSVILKRVITENGKSRLYINGSLAPARVVKELSANLLNVASQHDHQKLLNPVYHLDLIDTMGEHHVLRDQLSELFLLYKKKRQEREELQKQEEDKEQKKEFLAFQINEIRGASLQANEEEELFLEKTRLKNRDNLLQLSNESFSLLSSKILDELGVMRKHVGNIGELDVEAQKLVEDVNEYFFQGEDLSHRLRDYRDSLSSDPYRLDQVSARIDEIQGLKRKYGNSIQAVLLCAEEAEKELEALENLEIRVETIDDEIHRLELELLERAQDLSDKRRKTAEEIESSMTRELGSLAFGQASFEVTWQDCNGTIEEVGPNGWDRVEFYFSANPGEPARQLAKVASGGELSRLMLALKCLLARKDMVETVIFDEVDAGIGGEAAEAVARKIQELASHHQVFCITHLPQIAARGTDHYYVHKSVNGGRTLSTITSLDEPERENEIARMLAGDSATVETRAWAKELLRKSKVG